MYKTFMRLGLFVAFLAHSSSYADGIDIFASSDYCQQSTAKHPEYSQLLVPGWENGVANRSPRVEFACALEKIGREKNIDELKAVTTYLNQYLMEQRLQKFNQIAHSLNSYYLSYMVPAVYQRLLAAKASGIDINRYQVEMDAVAKHCEDPDASGQNLKLEADRYRNLVPEVNEDFASIHLQPMPVETHFRLVTIAALEVDRVERLIRNLEDKIKNSPAESPELESLQKKLSSLERRLIRIRFAYPELANFGPGNNNAEIKRILSATFHMDLVSNAALLDPESYLESILKITPPGQKPAGFVNDSDLKKNNRSIYSALYDDILKKGRGIDTQLMQAFKKAADISMQKALLAAHLKCGNPSPCMALQVQPALFSELIEELKDRDDFKDLACACGINDEVTHVSDHQNEIIGAVNLLLLPMALKWPNKATITLAIGAFFVDGGAGIAGIYDAYVNSHRLKNEFTLSAGGAADPLSELDLSNRERQAKFNLLYNIVTGVVSLIPPGKITKEFANLTFGSLVQNPKFLGYMKLETVKSTSNLPAPDLPANKYDETWEPRRFMPPLPVEIREAYPALMQNLSEAMGVSDFFADPSLRDKFMLGIKAAIQAMQKSGDKNDRQLLNEGHIRASAMPDPSQFQNFSFIQ